MSGEFSYEGKATMNILAKEKHPAWPAFMRFCAQQEISLEGKNWVQFWDAFKTGYTIAESTWR